jgi:hypothetical protein
MKKAMIFVVLAGCGGEYKSREEVLLARVQACKELGGTLTRTPRYCEPSFIPGIYNYCRAEKIECVGAKP